VRYLLDVNVWVALFDESHVHHTLALGFIDKPQLKIATCPLVENGVIRVLNIPRYSVHGPLGFETVRSKLDEICQSLNHEFWPDSVSLRNDTSVDWSRVLGHNQITDVYLLALVVSKKSCLVTLDHRMALSAVRGARAEHLMLL
jgi:uncharacterized protein